MDAHSFLHKFGLDETEKVVKAAGTNMNYFRQIACGARRPSVELADKLVAASEGRMEFEALLRGKSNGVAA